MYFDRKHISVKSVYLALLFSNYWPFRVQAIKRDLRGAVCIMRWGIKTG